ncbi:hypothetical protein PLESTB_000484900 [Pleodorina starrii]|uniref:Glucose-methanol-choline oxidoreductase C-terminal domain-containing protein n=1 Tax=Pleodorina starrii TaxID=330485 RepID=A0A9W6BFQ2_9CHLO|nr:hypothetical protein PLESTB_000484900 [Pleodorina starrii]
MQVRPLVATWRPLSPATRITTAAPAERVSLRHGTAIAPAGSRLLPARRPSAAAASHGAGDAAAEHYDVVIIGSGPVGSAFARKLVAGGQHVCMVDAGPRTSSKPGAHLKNAYKYQRDVNKFADHIRGALQTLSVPTNFASVPTLDPLAFNPPPTAKGYVRGNQNPYQSQQDNLPAAAATYNVGGMGTHWTCSCPRPTEIERNWLFPSDEAYSEAENILRVNQKAFLNYSIRDRTLNSVGGSSARPGGPAPERRGDIVAREFEPFCRHDLSVDPVPIPIDDADPNQWIPVSPERPWHAQVHRDAFAYGDAPPNVDSRLIVDLRFFGIVSQRFENHVEFHTCASKGVTDMMGLPQPTFHYKYTAEEKLLMHNMMEDMCYYASKVGGYLPGSEPQFMKPGLSLHIHGSTRVGDSPEDSVVGRTGRVHGTKNLFLGGNGLIPRAIACNPTLTSVAYALQASEFILRNSSSSGASRPERLA